MTLKDNFNEFHEEHPDVYDEIVALAKQVQARGYGKYGIASLFEVMRYHRATSGKDKMGFKMNNNFRAFYARLIMEQEPELQGFFHIREQKAVAV